jgi:ATP-dependent DNA ligase
MKPMLAKKFTARKINYPCFVQPKLNGIRGLYLGGDTFQSRSYGLEIEKQWHPDVVAPFVNRLRSTRFFFDGEFYAHGMSLQQINSRIGVNRNSPHPDASAISYNIFDIISDEPQHIRIEQLEALESVLKLPVAIVPTYYCVSAAFAEQAYKRFRDDGYEGMIYREFSSPYGRDYNCPNQENRWNCLLKRKEWQDFDCEIIGINESTEFIAIQQPHVSTLTLRSPTGATFNSAGLNHNQKVEYLQNPPIGKIAKIKYEVLSDGGVPLKPTIELVYE